jgi:hypothetical protein
LQGLSNVTGLRGRVSGSLIATSTDHNARGGDHCEQQIPGNGYPEAGRIGSSQKMSIPVGAHVNRDRAGAQHARGRPAEIGWPAARNAIWIKKADIGLAVARLTPWVAGDN